MIYFFIIVIVWGKKLNFERQHGTAESDRIKQLWGYDGDLDEHKMYSGYLNLDDGNKFYHYWFIEANDSDSKPWALWLNGGPGCSSMEGLFTENGPFTVTSNGSLINNPFGWTEYASIIYIESPIGVGFSYSTNPADYDRIGDHSTTRDSEHALEKFLERFPKYKSKPFYIMGESYAGIYIPLLLKRLSTNAQFKPILKGAAIGNGMHEYEINFNTQIFFAHSHGLIGPYLWGEILSDCCSNITEQCNFYATNNSDICALEISEVADLIWLSRLNYYNLYKKCYYGSSADFTRRNMLLHLPEHVKSHMKSNIATFYSKKRNLQLTPDCQNDQPLSDYLNHPEVIKQIHVKLVDSPQSKWELCSESVFQSYHKSVLNTNTYFQSFFDNIPDGRIMLYAGDIDMACNFIGVQHFAQSLNRVVTNEYTPWEFHDTSDDSIQIGGFIRQYDRLSFVSVKGAGHMVPTDMPISAQHMIKQFLDGKW